MNVQTRKQQFMCRKTIQPAFALILLCVLTLGSMSPALAQEISELRSADALKAECQSSLLKILSCKFVTLVTWTDALIGDSESQFRIAELHRRGFYEGPNRYIKAIKWYARAGEQSHCSAQYWVYTLYKEGAQGIEKNQQESHRWIEKSAISGCKSAFPLYSALLDTNSYLKTKRMAEAGEKRSQLKLALSYNKEDGVTKNNNFAFYWMFKAAEQDYPLAQLNLGILYFNGLGVEKNEEQALRWIKKSADQQLPNALFFLGLMYANGEAVEKNIAKALPLLLQASKHGFHQADATLAQIYTEGDGVKIDLIKAKQLKESVHVNFNSKESYSQLVNTW